MSSVEIVQDDARLRSLVSELAGQPLIALDSEADSLHSYRGKLCLLQLSTRESTVLIDPLAIADLSPLASVLADPSVRTVLHGADYDIRILDRDAGLRIAGLFDTMVAAKLLGRERVGLAALLDEMFGVPLDKASQRADWARRPLSARLVDYAANDTRHLPRLHDRLREELDRVGRLDWALEEYELLEAIRWEPAAVDAESFRRVKGAGRLDGRGLAVLRELVGWREAAAQEADRPPFKILGKEALLALARARPVSQDALRRVPGLGRRAHGASGRALLAAVRAGLEGEPVARRPRSPRPRRDLVAEKALAVAKARRDDLAVSLGLDAGVLLPNAVLEGIVRAARDGREDPFVVEGLRRWQRGLLEEPLGPLLPAPD